ncbi:MAG: NADH-quinone oxidoreductase subunit N, partial [Methanobacterium sp.]
MSTNVLGSGVGVFNGLFQVTTISQSIDFFIYLVGALVLLFGENITLTKKSINKGLSENDVTTRTSRGLIATLPSEYPLIVLFTVLGMSSLISSSDLVSMFLSIELQSFAVYILATIYRESESATSAGLKYFLLGSLSSALILLGSSLLYGLTGLTNFSGLYMLSSTYSTNHYIELSVLLMAIGLLFKVAAAPFHNWAPDVYDGVPTFVTSWLAIMPKLSLLVFLLEFQGFTQLTNWSSWTTLLLISSLLSLLIGTIGGLAQYRIKRLLAYSTISHIGFLLI